MNFRMIKYTIGWLLLFEAAFFVIPMLTAAAYLEPAFFSFLWSALICLAIGGIHVIRKPKNTTIYAREECVDKFFR